MPFPKFVDVLTLAAVQGLGLRARLVVEGVFAGLHRSPFKGFSVEFSECLASCGTAPVCLVNDDFHEGVAAENAQDLIAKYNG